MPRHPLSFLALLAAGAAFAQAPGNATREPLEPRQNQKIERIVHEDAGSRIEEVRHAGQTERITVSPKSGLPEYEVQPPSPGRQRAVDPRDESNGGRRQWNLFRF